MEEPVVESPEERFVPSDDPFVNQFLEAQRIWFLFETGIGMDFEDSKKGEVFGYEADFYRVTEPGIGTLQDLRDLLATCVESYIAGDAVYNSPYYREFDGVLYVCPSGRGDNMSISWVELSSESDDITGKVIVKVHLQDYFDALGDFFDTGSVVEYDYPFFLEGGKAVFTIMDYLCGPMPAGRARTGRDADSLEAKLVGLLEGKWIVQDGSSHYEIAADGSFTYYIGSEAAYSGQIFSSRSNDGIYMMNGEGISGTEFYLTADLQGNPVLSFDNGKTVFEREGKG